MDASIERSEPRESVSDVMAWVLLLLAYIWVLDPSIEGYPVLGKVFVVGVVGLAAWAVWRRGAPRERIGLRLDGFSSSVGIYLVAGVGWAGVAVLLLGDGLEPWRLDWPTPSGAAGLLVWAFLQQFCLLAFILDGLRQASRRSSTAVIAAAAIFAVLHLPNPFLTLYALGGGLIIGAVFVGRPNLLAAALAHATASWLANSLLGEQITGGMRVGPPYWM